MHQYTIESLSNEERKKLKELYERSPDRRVRKRSHMVLLSDMGYNLKEIAQIVMVSPKTVRTHIHSYEKGGIKALLDSDRPGAPSSLSKDQGQKIADWLKIYPRDLGYNQSNWSMKLLTHHVKKEFGIVLTKERMRQIAHELGFRPQRPRYKLVEADPEAKKKAKRQIKKWVKEAEQNEDLVLFVEDEMTAQLRPTLRWMWARKGEQPEVPIRDVHEERTLFGASNPLNGKTHYHVGKGRTKEEFLSLLKQLDRSYPPEKELVLMLDNASAHKAKMVTKFLQKAERITLVFLPPYCPDINPIERLWKWVREKVTHNYPFQSMNELIEAIRNAFRYFSNAKERVVSLLGAV